MPATSALTPETASESPRRLKTQERLMDAAFEVFSEVGIHAASVEMIAERAGFTRGAFYSNFDTKEELFLALADRGNVEQLALLSQGVQTLNHVIPKPTGGDRLQPADLASLVASFLEKQGDNRLWFLIQSELRLLAMREPSIGQRYLAQKREADAQLAIIIAAAFAAVGVQLKVDAGEVANVLTGIYERSLMEAIIEAGQDVPARAHELVLLRLPAVLAELAG
jgi:AcrR family transcriptional regulator